jgi:hypothetical protein
MRRMRITTLLTALGLMVLVGVTPARAASIHSFRVADEGSFIAWGVTICTKRGYFVSFKVRLEDDEGLVDSDRYGRKQPYHCTRTTFRWPDTYRSADYYGRIKMRVGETGEVRYTTWRTFHIR